MVVALIGDEATIKTYARVGKRIVLKAENAAYADIVPDPAAADCHILGRVYEVRRQL